MNKEILKLFKNIKVLVENNCLEEQFKTIADEYQNNVIMTLQGLNHILENEISYFGKESEIDE